MEIQSNRGVLLVPSQRMSTEITTSEMNEVQARIPLGRTVEMRPTTKRITPNASVGQASQLKPEKSVG